MAFRNSLLFIAFFLVATTSVANCTIFPPGTPGVQNLLPTTICASVSLINITGGVGRRTPLAGANVTLICNGVPIGPTTVVAGNGTVVITVASSNSTLINPSCTLSANVSIDGVTNTITSNLSSPVVLDTLLPLNLLTDIIAQPLDAVLVNGSFINVIV